MEMSELQPRPTFRSIRKWVSVRSRIPLELIEATGRERSAPVISARWQAMWLTKRLLGYGNAHIARLIGVDDSTVSTVVRRLEAAQTNLEDLALECAYDLRIPMEEPKINI